MKGDEPLHIGPIQAAFATALSTLSGWLLWAKWRTDSRRDRDDRSEKRDLATANVANQAAVNQQRLIDTFMSEREAERRTLIDMRAAHDADIKRQDEKIEQLKAQIEAQEASIRELTKTMLTKEELILSKEAEIQRLSLQVRDLQGENRLLRSTLESRERIKGRPAQMIEQSVAKFNIETEEPGQ